MALWRSMAAVSLVALISAGNPAFGKEHAAATQIDTLAREALKDSHIWGFSIGVEQDGRITFEHGYGRGGMGGAAATAGTIYHIDSVSKNITAAAILRLAEAGKLRLDDPLSKYVPEFSLLGYRVTVRQLLNHTSGIKGFTELPDWSAFEAKPMSHRQILDLVRNLPLDFGPGTSWRYSNSGFYLAGLVIERASGESYGDYLRHLFRQLGMNHSAFGCPGVLGHEIASGRARPAKPINWETPFSAGGVCSTANDLLLWEGALQSGRVISPKSLALMTAPTRLADGTKIDYGLGTRMGALQGHRVMGHTGTGGGFNAVLQYYPANRLAIAVLVNGSGLSSNALASHIARLLLGLAEPVVRQTAPLSPTRFSRYIGVYDSTEGPIELFNNVGTLAFRVPGQKQRLGTMAYQGDDTFAIAPDVFVKMLGRDPKAEWGIAYEHGLMMDAKRRLK